MMQTKLSSSMTQAADSRSINVLILEDRATDADLFVRELTQFGFDVRWKRVATKGDFCRALDNSYDVILADYSLPQFDGLEALQLVRQQKRNTPFLLISGAIGEEMAVEAIKRGAQDYLLKDRLARLGPAVMQALKNVKLQEQAAQDERQKNRLLQDLRIQVNELTTLQQIFHIVADERMSDDKLFQRIVDVLPDGWRYPELASAKLTIDDREYVAPRYEDTPHKLSARFRATCGQTGVIEVVYLDSAPGEDGELHLPEERSLLNTVAEIVQGCLDRRHSKTLLSRDAMVLANIHDAAIVTDTAGIVTFWNDGATRLFGWTAAEMLGRHYADRFSEDTRVWIQAQLKQRLAGTDWVGEYEDWRKDGSRVWIDARVTRMLDDEGHAAGMLGISRDITDRKRAESRLRESETRYRNIVESSHDLTAAVTTLIGQWNM